MLDGVSLDQLRTFIAVADEKSFSAAGRRLRRAQSVVSQTLANLEGQLRLKLFDRSARLPVLTDEGRALLANARAVAGDVDVLKARAKNLAGGLEPELSVAIDVMFPPAPLTTVVAAFQQEFPSTLLKFEIESSAVVEPVLVGRCLVGLAGSWSRVPSNISREPLLTINVPMIVSPQHPLASYRAPIPATVLAQYIQLIHMDPADVSPSRGSAVRSAKVWRLSHLGAKLAFLRAGLGYGALPLHVIEADLASGALVQIRLEDAPAEGFATAMSAIYRTDSPPGPAGRWFMERLKHVVAERRKEDASPDQPSQYRPQAATNHSIVIRPRGGTAAQPANPLRALSPVSAIDRPAISGNTFLYGELSRTAGPHLHGSGRSDATGDSGAT
jgi:DNA-binding transcriptional LysR family regulator